MIKTKFKVGDVFRSDWNEEIKILEIVKRGEKSQLFEEDNLVQIKTLTWKKYSNEEFYYVVVYKSGPKRKIKQEILEPWIDYLTWQKLRNEELITNKEIIKAPLRKVIPDKMVNLLSEYWCDSDNTRQENLGEFIQRVAQITFDLQKEYCVHREDEKYLGVWKSDCGLNGSYTGGTYCYNCGRKIKRIESEISKELTLKLQEERENDEKFRKDGFDVWAEYGGKKVAKHVNSKKFGPHKYIDCDGTSDCEYGCGCWMGPARSGGPVDPWGTEQLT